MSMLNNYMRASIFAAGLLVGCSTTAPLSVLNGQPLTMTDASLYPVRIVSVDGSLQFGKTVQVAPGLRSLVLEAAPSDGARGTTQMTVTFAVEPCTSYRLAARRASPMSSAWTLVIDAKQKVEFCKPEDEFKKATAEVQVESVAV